MKKIKRKLSEGDESCSNKLVNRQNDSVFFKDCSIFLHPAALGLTKRKIFERGISLHGGEILKSLGDFSTKKLIVVFDEFIQDEKLQGLVSKSSASITNKDHVFVKSQWLTKCLQEKCILPYQDYEVKEVTERDSQDDSGSSVNLSERLSDISSPPTDITGQNQSILMSHFVCSQSSQLPQMHKNEAITNELQKLVETYKCSNDRWRAFGYEKAISAIKRHPKQITTHEEASKIPGVGKKMADKIIEILESGSLEKVSKICESEKALTIGLFNRVWGAGPASAEAWYKQGFRSLDDLWTKGALNRHQKIGLKHFYDLDERMNRSEAAKIESYVREAANELQKGLEVIACGSYRRGKPTCGDIDILITHAEKVPLEGFFDRLLEKLRHENFLTDDLTVKRDGNQQKYLGVCRLPEPGSKHRRLDIIVVPYSERAPALLYFTGSAHFNRSMRLLASKMGMALSEHSLRSEVVRIGQKKVNSGTRLHTPSEESIFEFLNLPFREPHERDH